MRNGAFKNPTVHNYIRFQTDTDECRTSSGIDSITWRWPAETEDVTGDRNTRLVCSVDSMKISSLALRTHFHRVNVNILRRVDEQGWLFDVYISRRSDDGRESLRYSEWDLWKWVVFPFQNICKIGKIIVIFSIHIYLEVLFVAWEDYTDTENDFWLYWRFFSFKLQDLINKSNF